MAKSNRYNRPMIFAEILQNGVILADTQKPLRPGVKLELTNSYKGDLALPLYPLNGDIRVLQVRKANRAELILDHHWSGFYTSKGQATEVDRSTLPTDPPELYNGDYASLAHGELQLLIRIAPETHAEPIVPNKTYRGSLLRLVFSDPGDSQHFAFAVIAAVILLLGPIMGLSLRPDDRPRRFEDLSQEYVLPFIAPEHIASAPEALQEHLDRTIPIRSVITYYRELIGLLVGRKLNHPELILETTRTRYQNMFQTQQAQILEIQSARHKQTIDILNQNGTAVLSMAVVEGESYQGSLLRLIDKLEINHDAFSENLRIRREFIDEFLKDQPYDYQKYKETSVINERAAKQLMQIKPWKTLTDEAIMYREVNRLAIKAARENKRILLARKDFVQLLPENARPISIPKDSVHFALLSDLTTWPQQHKFRQLAGSEFGLKAKKVIREPVIGHLEPKLVERFLVKKRFELKLCYELALRKNRKAQGLLELKWRINSRGKVDDIEILDAKIRDSDLVQCVRKKLRSWRFPRPRRGSVEIVHGFDFRPEKT